MSIASIQHQGVLIDECAQDGERHSDDTVPAHPNGIPVSATRWLLVYATRRFRGNDDDCSIVYQLRADQPDGKLIREGMLARTTEDWVPDGFRPGKSYKKEHRHPAAFGVPKGAVINGNKASNSNVFVIQWGTVARDYDPHLNYVEGTSPDPEVVRRTLCTEWIQVRLNEAEDDIETICPIGQLRQVGFETGAVICTAEGAHWTVSCMQSALPYNRDCTEWVETAHFDGGRMAARKFRYNSLRGLYEWIETGPYIFDPEGQYGGGHLVPYKGEWAVVRVASRIDGHVWHGRGLGWVRLEDPFAPLSEKSPSPEPIRPPLPATRAPATFFVCADGVLRCFAGEGPSSPYERERDPLYCWDIDPDDGFRASNRRVIYDTVQAGLPIRPEARPMVDMCKLLFHQGATQYLVHRVIFTAMRREHVHTRPEFWIFPPMNQAELESCGIYYATITYDEVAPLPWSFPPAREKTP